MEYNTNNCIKKNEKDFQKSKSLPTCEFFEKEFQKYNIQNTMIRENYKKLNYKEFIKIYKSEQPRT